MRKTKFTLAGLFAGVGGIELGFSLAGFNPVFANEIDRYASITYRLNHQHKLVTKDIHNLETKEIPKIDVLTGGFPCQAFSVAGYRKGFRDPRGNVFWEIIRILEAKKPEVVFLENVKNLGNHDQGKTFRTILNALKSVGYGIKYQIFNAKDFGGVPQNRERIYIVGFKSKKLLESFCFPNPDYKKTSLDKFIDFESKMDEAYYYDNKYMANKLKESIKSKNTIYQWRRQYVRENKSGLCPTLTANMGTGGHNVPLILSKHGIRKLTPRECFLLMGFPKKFRLPDSLAKSHLYKQAGNAVVVPVIEKIALNIIATLNGMPLPSALDDYQGSLFDL